MRYVAVLLIVLVGVVPAQDAAQPAAPAKAKTEASAKATLAKKQLESLQWRSIGPANMGGRITSIAVYEKDPTMWWVATASGGLLKTINNGVTFEHQFDKEKTVSIGDVAVAQSDPAIVWVGTGESNPRNSVSWGDGVYKSTDGGKTWKNMGLAKSFQIGAVRIHPTNPDIVYVGACGRLWGPNEQRGLFKTADGGKTWSKILYIDDKTGVIDVQLHPKDPDTFLVATYEHQRDGFDTNDPAKKWGPGSGLYRTTNGGKTFDKISQGLPTGKLGRIGLEYYRKNPDVVYMVLESERLGKEPENAPYMGITGADADAGAKLTTIAKAGPAEKAGLKQGDIVLAIDDKTVHSYNDLIRLARQHVAGETVKVEVSRQRKSVVVDLEFGQRPKPPEPEPGAQGAARPRPQRGPRGRRSPFAAGLGGQRANFHDQQGKEGHEYGGVYKSTDGGKSWIRINSNNPRPMYFSEIRIDPSDDRYQWVLGIRLWKSEDGGAKMTPDGHGRGVHVDHHALWIDPRDGRHMILGNDGGLYLTYDRGKNWDHLNHVAIGQFYHVGVGPRRAYKVYGGLQDNGSWGGPSRVRHAAGPTNQDWIRIGGGDGFRCLVDRNDPDLIYFESQNGGIGRRHLRTAERAGFRPRPPRQPRARGQAGQAGPAGQKQPQQPQQPQQRYRFNWNTPFVLSAHNSKIYYVGGNRVFRSLDRGNRLKAISPEITVTDRGSATALAESPLAENVVYVGTDDGGLWVTKNGGHDWTDLYTIKPPTTDPQPKPPVAVDKPQPEPRPGAIIPARKEEKPAAKPPEVRVSAAKAPAAKAPAAKAPAAKAPAAKAPEAKDPEAKKEEKPAEEPQPALSDRAQQMIDRLMDMDANGDGSLQQGELPERMQGFFARADANDDGVVDKKELIAMAQRFGRGGRGGSRGARGPGRGARGARRGGTPAAAAQQAEPKAQPQGKTIQELVPERRWVSWIEPSRFKAGRAYLVFDGHRSDDDRPHIYATEDHGQSWRSIRGNLPDSAGTTRVVREDIKNENLLFLGTEFGAWVSIDRGESWTSLNTNLPTVAVHAFAIHPTAGEIVAGTHGRSLWVLDVTVLRQMTKDTLEADAHLYKPNTAIQWRPLPSRGRGRTFTGQNPSSGAEIFYSLKKKARSVSLKITGQDGKAVRELEASVEPGLHRMSWNLRRERPGNSRWRRFGRRVSPGTYKVVLDVNGETFAQDLTVEIDPDHPDERWIAYEETAEQMEAERKEASSRRKYPWLHEERGDE